jgi:hypothetical protein
MKKIAPSLVASLLLAIASTASVRLSAAEGEWVSLFDGKSFAGWTGADGAAPGPGWSIADGELRLDGKGGNLFSELEFADFELEWEWKLEEGGNNGVKYWVTKVGGKEWLGIEYQMLDDEKHPDGKNGAKRRTASFYDIDAPVEGTKPKPSGEWNLSRVVAKDGKLQHWLNGELVGEADTRSETWKAKIGESKFKAKEGFAPGKGRIMLTDHSDRTWFRNIRVREL